jgi:hypothetical protein
VTLKSNDAPFLNQRVVFAGLTSGMFIAAFSIAMRASPHFFTGTGGWLSIAFGGFVIAPPMYFLAPFKLDSFGSRLIKLFQWLLIAVATTSLVLLVCVNALSL